MTAALSMREAFARMLARDVPEVEWWYMRLLPDGRCYVWTYWSNGRITYREIPVHNA